MRTTIGRRNFDRSLSVSRALAESETLSKKDSAAEKKVNKNSKVEEAKETELVQGDAGARETEVRVVTYLIRGVWTVDIREWYLDDDGEWCAGEQSITLKMSDVLEVTEGINEAVTALRAAGVPLDPDEVRS